MVRIEGWEDPKGAAHVLRGDRLLLATEEVLEQTAHNAMLLSQGAECAIEMHREDALEQSPSPIAG